MYVCILYVYMYVCVCTYIGSNTNNALFYYKIYYYKIISMSFCNITLAHSSIPNDILGEMFKLLSISCETFTYPSNHTQARFPSAGPCMVATIIH